MAEEADFVVVVAGGRNGAVGFEELERDDGRRRRRRSERSGFAERGVELERDGVVGDLGTVVVAGRGLW